ncbi:MAG: ABC transporter permease [Lachnospiraceae bacterium]|nr:ABC transporter permease [Lachnospiraceae bacterium]
MYKYILKRILAMIPVMIGVSFVIFFLLYLTPGDPATLALGETATEEVKEQWREEYGLNDPLLVQYGRYMLNLVTKGDLGTSYKTGKTVTTSIMERYPVTFLLAITSCTVAIILGLLLGIVAANRQNSWIDTLVRLLGMAGVSAPIFWVGLLLISFFAVRLQWLPVSGFYGPRYWILPSVTIGIAHAANLMRVTRSSMLDCIRMDYVTTARSKGQEEGYITRHHVLRNALIPIITAVGQSFGVALGGAMIVEQIFSIPGVGRLIADAISSRDYPVIRGSVIVLALGICVVNLLVDILYAAVDPRIKSQFQGVKKVKKEAQA